jgi:hypothetical protein
VKDWIQEAKIQVETLFQNNVLNKKEFITILSTKLKIKSPPAPPIKKTKY